MSERPTTEHALKTALDCLPDIERVMARVEGFEARELLRFSDAAERVAQRRGDGKFTIKEAKEELRAPTPRPSVFETGEWYAEPPKVQSDADGVPVTGEARG